MRWTEEQLAEYQSRNYKTMPHEADEGPESELQKKCERWLRENGFPYFHDRSRGKNKRGIPDLICFLGEGRVVVIELKAKSGRMSEEQKETMMRLKYLGHEVHEVRSYKRFLYLVANGPEAYEDQRG